MTYGPYAGELTFAIRAGETVTPGDWIVVDQATGRARKGVAGQDSGGFTVPLGSVVDHATGTLVMPLSPVPVTGRPLSPLTSETSDDR